jgi:hypothetical protein
MDVIEHIPKVVEGLTGVNITKAIKTSQRRI